MAAVEDTRAPAARLLTQSLTHCRAVRCLLVCVVLLLSLLLLLLSVSRAWLGRRVCGSVIALLPPPSSLLPPSCCFVCVDCLPLVRVCLLCVLFVCLFVCSVCWLQVVFHYYYDRLLHCDVDRLLSLTPLLHSFIRSVSHVTIPSTLCSGLPHLLLRLIAAVQQTAAELCKLRATLIEPLFALLKDAADTVLQPLTPHANQLVWRAWQQCKAAVSEQQVDSIEHILQQPAQQTSAAGPQ